MTDPLRALPDDAVLVHIGPHKTGTTAIQGTLASCRKSLEAHGVSYPGDALAHHEQAKSLRQVRTGWQHDSSEPPNPALWTRLVQQVQSLPGRVVISSEFFANADADARARLVDELGPERVHILAAARNSGAIAVSTWQQMLKEGYPVALETWLQRNFRRDDADVEPSGFWLQADPAALSRSWAEAVGPDRVTVLVIDETDRRLLPSTFEALLGLPAGLLADNVPSMTNRGLTAVEASLLYQVNVVLKAQLSWREYNNLVREGVVRRLIEVRKPGPDEAKPQLPAWAAEQAVVESERCVDALRGSGVRVVGDLEALRTAPVALAVGTPFADVPLADIPVAVAAEAVVGALAAGARGTWSLDDPSHPERGPRVAGLTARELTDLLGQRIGAGLRRRYRKYRRRLSKPSK